MNLQDLEAGVSLLLSLFALVGAVYAIAKNEAAMQHKIDSLKS